MAPKLCAVELGERVLQPTTLLVCFQILSTVRLEDVPTHDHLFPHSASIIAISIQSPSLRYGTMATSVCVCVCVCLCVGLRRFGVGGGERKTNHPASELALYAHPQLPKYRFILPLFLPLLLPLMDGPLLPLCIAKAGGKSSSRRRIYDYIYIYIYIKPSAECPFLLLLQWRNISPSS